MDYHSKVRDSLNYIEENLNNKIDLDDLAKKAYLSKYHYHRIFHKPGYRTDAVFGIR